MCRAAAPKYPPQHQTRKPSLSPEELTSFNEGLDQWPKLDFSGNPGPRQAETASKVNRNLENVAGHLQNVAGTFVSVNDHFMKIK